MCNCTGNCGCSTVSLPIGPAGPPGLQGGTGPQGPQGIQGNQGIQGPPGLSSGDLSVNTTYTLGPGYPVTAIPTGGTAPYLYLWEDKLLLWTPYTVSGLNPGTSITMVKGLIFGATNLSTVAVIPDPVVPESKVMHTHLQCTVTDAAGNKAICYFVHHVYIP